MKPAKITPSRKDWQCWPAGPGHLLTSLDPELLVPHLPCALCRVPIIHLSALNPSCPSASVPTCTNTACFSRGDLQGSEPTSSGIVSVALPRGPPPLCAVQVPSSQCHATACPRRPMTQLHCPKPMDQKQSWPGDSMAQIWPRSRSREGQPHCRAA